MQKITLGEARELDSIDELIIHSIELSLYIAFVIVDGNYYALTQSRFKAYKRHCVENIKTDFADVQVKKISLVHESAYDEMIGQPPKTASNALSVPQSNGVDYSIEY